MFTSIARCRESGKANDAGLAAALICSCTAASDFPAAANQACATLFFTCTRMMPAFSGPLTLPKRVRLSCSSLSSLPLTITTALAPWFRALMALVISAACCVSP